MNWVEPDNLNILSPLWAGGGALGGVATSAHITVFAISVLLPKWAFDFTEIRCIMDIFEIQILQKVPWHNMYLRTYY